MTYAPHEYAAGVRRVSLSAIVAGTFITLALMVMFTTLGLAIGMSVFDPAQGDGLGGFGTGSAVYLVITQLISLAAGGYAAAQFVGPVPTMSAALQGAAVWALATLLMAWAAISGGSAVFGASGALLSNAGQATVNAADALIPDDIDLPDISQMADRISVDDLPPEVQQVLNDASITTQRLRTEARETLQDVTSPEERQRAINIVRRTAADVLANPTNAGDRIERAFDNLFQGPNAVLSAEDREEAFDTLARRLGIDPADAEQVVNEIEADFREAADTVRETIDDAKEEAVQAAQAATDAVAQASIWLTIASLLGLAAAAGAAAGGRRDW
ncbi:hypothetical protein OCGS_1414 [Oceaniovalibus guishaninsula JLT2003]|uniref:PhnA-like protein n=1 Tax=Oceaniovalibus guishaninsula JLT2003 TaxID=1231392 RepID=K2GPJ3_9RHOB|nr:hypothetical protein [Oceaniovalibus guishaninsula]EKE44576.1 hypothetical protein OCGS_1414 [Oceaniovalibus guishaninsula JLT2003]